MDHWEQGRRCVRNFVSLGEVVHSRDTKAEEREAVSSALEASSFPAAEDLRDQTCTLDNNEPVAALGFEAVAAACMLVAFAACSLESRTLWYR